ncbi:MAG: hypothetical protein Q7S92_00750 [Candidatus Diapherotrites archaeon]|nr:hypothetical protein [Candidatus Diapherotrites archaeon]
MKSSKGFGASIEVFLVFLGLLLMVHLSLNAFSFKSLNLAEQEKEMQELNQIQLLDLNIDWTQIENSGYLNKQNIAKMKWENGKSIQAQLSICSKTEKRFERIDFQNQQKVRITWRLCFE